MPVRSQPEFSIITAGERRNESEDRATYAVRLHINEAHAPTPTPTDAS